ncbi:DUF5753 domain-containing protein [Saccharopolyspora pogona]|uniref:DUF5753 domain-containing protein n=1 Tax=Saccharopolyspora pogona TaxID=333966 RepID=UPI0037C99B53
MVGERYEEIVGLAYDTDAPQWVATRLPDQKQQLSALVDYEQNASEIIEVAPLLIPGLLQTGSYVRAIMSGGGVPSGEIATRAAIRIGRKDVILRNEPARLRALVGEGALRQVVGDRDTMIEQLRHLSDMSERPNIDLRIVPYRSGWNPSLEGGFLLIKQEKLDPVVALENRRSGLFLHEYDDVTVYEQAVEKITQVALNPTAPAKPPNKTSVAEVVEERGLAKGNTARLTRPGHRAGPGVPHGLDRVREVARRDKEARFTALLHHVDLNRLRAASGRFAHRPRREWTV